MSQLDFSMGDDEGSQRRAFRAKIPGLAVRDTTSGVSYDVGDLSAMGLAFKDDDRSYKEGQNIEFDLLINKKTFIPALTAKVMRCLDNGLVGCNFESVDHRKEAKLDKLVLEVQKRMIEMRKKSKSK